MKTWKFMVNTQIPLQEPGATWQSAVLPATGPEDHI